jgi:hypothetical protein
VRLTKVDEPGGTSRRRDVTPGCDRSKCPLDVLEEGHSSTHEDHYERKGRFAKTRVEATTTANLMRLRTAPTTLTP